jgi:hypothetical protein
MPDVVELLEGCIRSLGKGSLTEEQLREVQTKLRQSDHVQDLLYLQTVTTSLESKVIGMTMLRAGKIDDGPSDYESWPYKTVAAAISDGWRVIRFPAEVPAAHSQNNHVICEFILERFGEP